MNVLSRFLKSIDNYVARQESRQIEAFLAKAQNRGELESRMRLLDSNTNHPHF